MVTTLTARRIIFIDPTVPDLQTLLDGIGADAVAVVLDPGQDGVQQILDFLLANELSDLSAIQIVSHGSEGSITLGSTVLDNGNVVSYAAALAQIGAALAADGDIMLYGCDVADNTAGQQFIAALASLTGADVAASTDPTGAAALGGDWVLEASTGPIEAAPAFTAEAESNFNGLLGAFVSNEIISVSSAGVQGNAVSWTGSGGTQTAATNNIPTDTNNLRSSISGDGRYVAFVSDANTLASDSNVFRDVFLRDRFTGTTTLVSVGIGGAAANGPSFTASVSNDGNLVVFASTATNLVAGDFDDTLTDIYLRNISAGTTEKISAGTNLIGASGLSEYAAISGNGQFVAFQSTASDLVAGQTDINQASDVYLRDLTTGTTTRVSVPTGGPAANGGGGSFADVSTDGRWVVFESGATDLVGAGSVGGLKTTGSLDVFRWDRLTNTTIRVSLTDTEGQGNGTSSVASVSDDGNIIAFLSSASNLVADDPNGSTTDVFVRNVSAGTTVRISSLPSGPVSQYPSVSGDGRYVAFLQNNQILIYDLQTGLTQSEPFTTSGTLTTVVNGRPLISADGTTVVFQSTATNLVASDTNGVQDVFVTPAFWPPLPGRPIFGNEFGGTHPDADLFDFLGPISNDANIDLLTLTVTNVINGAAEKLRINTTFVDLVNSVNVSAGSGLLVDVALSGTTATVTIKTPVAGITAAELQALVEGFIYQNTSATPGPLSRVVTLTGISEVGDATTQALSISAVASPPRVTELVSVSTDGAQASNGAPMVHSGANTFGITTGNETARAISDDGRYIVFQSTASTLVAGDTNAGPNGAGQDIFRHDMLTGETIRVSVANDGSQANALSANASISADGNRVLFSSDATNLLPTADPFGRDLFIRDINAGTTTKVNLTDAGIEIPTGGTIDFSEISGDGTAVSFATLTQGYVAADTDSFADIYVRLLAGNTLLGTGSLPAGPTTVRVSVADNEAAPDGNSNSPSISSTGRFVAFASTATNLVGAAFGSEGGDDTNGLQDIFVRDLVAGTTKRINLVEGGANPDTQATTGFSFAPALSADGNLIVFASTSALTANDLDTTSDIFLRNIGTTTINGIAPGTTILVSGSPLVTLGVNTTPTISPDGEHIAFLNTNATTLWVYDVLTGVTGRAVSTTAGALAGSAAVASLSNDSIAFQSGSQQLVQNDTVAGQDVFWAPVETLVLGGTIWNDNGAGGGGIASNGIKDGTEPGIANVTLALFSDANNDNVADNLLSPLQTATTNVTGDYQFTGLAPGNYIVRVNQTNFDAGGALVATPLSPVTSPEPPDPDNDINNDDNGARVIGQPAFSNSITLAYGTEPINDGDTIADTNFTLDFGFLGNPPPQILNLGGDTATFTEGGPAVLLDDSSAPEVAATVTDDQGNLSGGNLTVSITANKVAAEDVLGFAVSPATTVTLSDGTNVGSTVSVGGVAIGTIAALGTGTGTNNLIVTFNASATPTNASTLIQALTYADTNTLDPSTSPRTIAVSVNDGLGGTDSENVTVNVVDVNDEPTLIATAVNPTFTEGDASPADVFTTPIVASTTEAGQTFTGMTLTITNVTDGANEVLFFNGTNFSLVTGNGPPGVTVSVVDSIATVAVTGLALNAADLQTLVDGIGYRNLSESPTDANRVVTITELVDSGSTVPSNDNTAALNIVSTVNVDAVNDAPTATITPPTYNATENVALSLKNNGLSVSDPDSGSGIVTVGLLVSEGIVNVNAGGSGVTVLSNGTNSVNLKGTIAQINALLNTDATSTVEYIENDDTPSASVIFSLLINDGGNTGSGTPLSGGDTATINITAVNDLPVVGNLTPSINYVVAAPPQTLSSGATVTDVDSANLTSASVTLTDHQAGDELSVNGAVVGGPVNGISWSYNPATGVLSFIGPSALANYQALLDTVQYRSTSGDPSNGGATTSRDVAWIVNDGTDPSVTQHTSINVGNAAPTVDLNGAAAGTNAEELFAENAGAIPVAPATLVLADADDANLTSATIVLTNAKAGDSLSISGALPGGITSNITTGAGTITVTLSGSASKANYTTAIQQVQFNNGSDNPDTTDRQITVTVNDGEDNSNSAITTVHVGGVNDGPTNTVPATQNIEANTATAIGGLAVTDPDSGGASITTTLSVAHGTLTVASAGGAAVSGSGTGTVTLTGSVAAINTTLSAANNVVYTGAHDFFGTDTLTVLTNDLGNTATGGPLSDTDNVTLNVSPPIAGTSGNDSYNALPGQERIDAGGGIDTVTFNFKLVDASVKYEGNKVIIDGPTGSHTVLTGFEVFNFTDGTVHNDDGSPLIDDLFYYSKYHDVWNVHADADAHYNATGWHEGRDPDAFFSTAIYLSANPDVKASGVNPLTHFDTAGWIEGRVPSINFDPAQYLAANPDVAAAHIDPLAHFLQFGAGEGRQPFAPSELIAANGFDYVYYLNNNPDVAASGVDPFLHFQTVGWQEGRNPNALFDTNGYLANYADVQAAHVNPLDHYNNFGWHEGRDPSVGFDTTSYLAAYADVNAANVNPLTHFLHYGIHEGRAPFADGVWG